MVLTKMNTRITFWLIWLIWWHASGSHAQTCSQVAAQPAPNTNGLGCETSNTVQAPAAPASGSSCPQPQPAQSQGACGAQQANRQLGTTQQQQGLATVSLHEYVYKSDFAGFRERMRFLDNRENHPTLVGALQSTDDKGLTIAHLLACAGRTDELFLVTQAVHKLYEGLPLQQANTFRRVALEGLSHNASCTSCQQDRRTEHEVVPHLRLELTHPKPQTIFLYGNVTPLECAAAHGHVPVMKQLMQRGVSAGRVLIVAQHFGLENQLFEAAGQARAEGGFGVELAQDLPLKPDIPMRKPRQRRTEPKKGSSRSKASSTSASSSNSNSGTTSKKAAAATAAAFKLQQQQQQQQQQGKCGAQPQPPALKMSPVSLEMGPGGQAASIGSVASSLLAVRGKENQDPSKPATTPTQLSEFMDVTALWLLSIMLFFPAWSTFCLVWRKMIKRRWALQESVARIRRAVAAVATPFKRDSTAAAAAAAAAASTTAAGAGAASPVPQRSSSSGSSQDGNKAASGKAAAAGAAARQQRKVGPNITLPGSPQAARLSAVKAASPTGGGLFRAISAPETSLRAHTANNTNSSSSSPAKAAHAADGSHTPTAAGVRRQSSTAASASSSSSVATRSAVASLPPSRLGRTQAASPDVSLPHQTPQAQSSSAAAATTTQGAGSGPSALSSGTNSTSSNSSTKQAGAAAAADTPSKQQKRGKAASSASPAREKEAAVKPTTPVTDSHSKAAAADGKGTSSAPKAAAAAPNRAAKDASASTNTALAAEQKQAAAKHQPQALHKTSKASQGGRASSTAAAAAAAAAAVAGSAKDSPRADSASKAASNTASAAAAAAATAAMSISATGKTPHTSTSVARVKPRPMSALSAALRPTVSDAAAAAAAAATAAVRSEVPSRLASSSSKLACSGSSSHAASRSKTHSSTSAPNRSEGCLSLQAGLSPRAGYQQQGNSSSSTATIGRSHTVSAAAAAAAATREAVAAAAAATAGLRHTSSGIVIPGRGVTPHKDLDDILTQHCRDQDRPHHHTDGTGAAAAGSSSSREAASSAPSGNAWTPAAAAARAARASGCGSSSSGKALEENEAKELEGTADSLRPSAAAAAAGRTSEGRAKAAGQGDYSDALTASGSGCSTAAAGAADDGDDDDDDEDQTATDSSGGSDGSNISSTSSLEQPVAEGSGVYAESLAAAAIAAGILASPVKPSPAADQPAYVFELGQAAHGGASPAATPPPGLSRSSHSSSAAEAASRQVTASLAFSATPQATGTPAAATAAADGATDDGDYNNKNNSSSSTHSPMLDPPVVLLPGSLMSCMDAAPGGAAAGSGAGAGLFRSVSAMEPKALHDLADLVASSIAQAVATSAAAAAATGGGEAGGTGDGGLVEQQQQQVATHVGQQQEGRCSDSGSQWTPRSSEGTARGDGTATQLVHQSLDEVFARFTASNKAVGGGGAAAAGGGGGGGSLLPSLPEEASAAAAGPTGTPAKADVDCFTYDGSSLFADLAATLHNRPAESSPQQQQQQQDAPVSTPPRGSAEQEQQQGWFAVPPISSAPVLAVSGGMVPSVPVGDCPAAGPLMGPPPGLLHGVMNLPASTALQRPPAGNNTAMLAAQGLAVASQQPQPQLQPQLQQQRVVLQPVIVQQQVVQQQVMQQQHQQQHVMQQPVLVAVAPRQQAVQMVPVQHVATAQGPAQPQIIRLANGQLVQGQLVAVQGQQMNAVPIMAAPAAGAGGVPHQVIMAPAGVVNMHPQVNHTAVLQQQQQMHRVFYPQNMLQGPQQVRLQQQGHFVQQQQQVQLQPGMHVLHPAGCQVVGVGSAPQQPTPLQAATSGGFTAMQLQHQHQLQQPKQHGAFGGSSSHNRDGSRLLSSSPMGSAGSQQEPSPVRVTVLQAPAGPGATAAATATATQDSQLHQEAGVPVACPDSSSASKTVAATSQQLEPTESAQMAAELDELLHQANQLVGWSCLPKDEGPGKAADTSSQHGTQQGPFVAAAAGPPAASGLDTLQLPDGFTSSGL